MSTRGLPLSLRLALRDLRTGVRGFRIFLACLALGVAAIAAVQSLSAASRAGIAHDGRALLGGDVLLRQIFHPADPAAQAFLARAGTLSQGAELRAMARTEGAGTAARSALVELKAVDRSYPLYGRVTLDPAGPLGSALAERGGVWGVAVEPLLLDQLGLKRGDMIRIGDARFQIRAVIAREPDRLAGGFMLGPRVMIADRALPATGLVQPGSMIYWTYALRLPAADNAAAFAQALKTRFPDAAWRVRTPSDAAPRLQGFIDRLASFLTLVGLAALLVGGVGIANAVKSHLDGRTGTIAILKCLGAPGRLVHRIYLIQVLIIGAVGIAIGLVLGSVAPALVAAFAGGLLPIELPTGVRPDALAMAAGFGLLTVLAFSLWPLARARAVPAAALMRSAQVPAGLGMGRHAVPAAAATLLAVAALAFLAVATADNRLIALVFVAGSAALFMLFLGAGALMTRLAARLRRFGRPVVRLAAANLHRPGNPTGAVILSLGLGLTVLVAVALVEGNFSRRIEADIPKHAPAYFFVDIQPADLPAFRALLGSIKGASNLEEVPSLRGRIVAVDGRDPQSALVDKGEGWVLQGDRGVTYAAAEPEGTRLASGTWWPKDYAGPPLVSVAADVARAFHVGVGDSLTVNILGRPVTARIANVRTVDWSTLGINFTMLFAPGLLEQAPHTVMATVRATPAAEPLIQRDVSARFPTITIVRVKEALQQADDLVSGIGMIVRLVASLTLIAGVLVLGGAIASGHRRRVYDAVVLKVLGATRRDVLLSFLLECGALGLVAALASVALGTLAAWAVLTRVMHWPWVFLPATAAATVAGALAITLVLGFAATWRALGQSAAAILRNE